MKRGDRTNRGYGPALRDRRPARQPDEGSTARRLLWAILGALAYVAAKYAFGF